MTSRQRTVNLTAALLVLFVIAGCANYAGWTASANDTTCDQWVGEMTESQRLAMARLVLATLRIDDVRASAVEERARAFMEAITQACGTDAIKQRDLHNITRVGLYVFDESRDFRP
jgi:hypothetical protein